MANLPLLAALNTIRTLQSHGHQALLAGGCVRDLLLGRTPADFDVATDAPPTRVLTLFPRCFAVGAHFGVVLVANELPGGERLTTEVATFRTESSYSDGRHPDQVRYSTRPEEDVARRDFTINGLLLDPAQLFPGGQIPSIDLAAISDNGPDEILLAAFASGSLAGPAAVKDFVGGLSDLRSGTLRAIGQPHLRFDEDRLRLLRAIRFAARFSFQIEPSTLAAIQTLAPRVSSVSRERLRDELTRMLTEGQARRAFELLDLSGLLPHLLPEVARMQGVQQPPEFHPEGDVFVHTLGLLAQLPSGCPMELAWAALLHDSGKPATYTLTDRIRFNGHPEIGAVIAAALAERFRFSNQESELLTALVANHMRFGDIRRMKASTLKRFFRQPSFDLHLELHRMDATACGGRLENYEFALEKLADFAHQELRPKPLLNGHDLCRMGYQPSPEFKKMLELAEDAQLEGRISTALEAEALVRAAFPIM